MTIPVKGASEEDVAFLSRMIEWDSHNHMILTWIRNTSIPSISNLLDSFDDAKFAWDMLTKRYSTTHGSMKYQLVVELHQLRQEPGQSINDYYDQLHFIWDQIDLSDPTWACSKDAQRNSSCNPSSQNKLNVLAITPSTPLIEQPQQLGDFSGSSNRRKQTNKKFCNYCKRPSHTIETCYRRNKSTAAVANTEPTPPTASISAESQSSAYTINLSSTELQEIIAQAVRMAGNASLSTALSVLPGKSQTWLFDSACCNHMTPHSSLFSNLDLAPHPLNIHIADGSTMHGNSLGFVSTSNLSVPRVFHDPRTGQELGTGPRVGRMFPMNNLHLPPVAPVSVAAAAAAVSSLPSLALWHSRLGHAPSSRVEQLVSRVPTPFWGEASLHAVHAINCIPSAVIHNQTPLMSTTNLSLDLDSVVSLVMAKLKRAWVPAPALPEDPPQDIPPRHSTRVRSIPPHLLDYHCYTALATLHESQTYCEAFTDPLWQIAMKEELDASTKNHTWDLVTLPPGQSVVGCFTQEYGIDYEETFAPVARISSVCALLAVAAARKWDLFQMDVKNAFLNGDLSEEVYMQPRNLLLVSLLNQTSSYDSALFLRRTDKGTILLLLYVDDMIITGDDLSGIQELKDFLSQQFEMKDLGHLSYFLGLEITHSTDGLYITQAKYASDLLSQAGLTDNKTVDTPVELNAHLTPSRGKPLSNPSLYRRLVSQYLSAPRSTHYAVVLRILRYLKGDPTDPRSTIGYCFLLGSSLISWRSKKQTFVARSSTEAEYRALADTTSELLWLRSLLKDLGVSTSSATPLYCDNQSAIHIAHNDVFHERTKHIEIDCHFIRYHLVHGALKLFSVSSKDQLADIFTKSLPKRRTRDLVDNLKLVSHPP
ncbi:Retrovirus-related Pol polyprotein from transposon RE1 [Vitis vinifera]|uniref:Retrovirus-related Pol polyprotein from transposon RE1 n=1 Tax=Vitis vinifera TaxID=29760 RepID=A0A438G7L0_VITVI|nr:Retrovirus-related Pol polyprotein from transposon RE1 [Vitis vinifera]